MSDELKILLNNNKEWAQNLLTSDPDFFNNLSNYQNPKYLWIGCSDSRVPANQIIGLKPGEVFVHRNVANIVPHADINCLSVIQYAVEMLKVEHIIVTGHYGCGGIQAAMSNVDHGQIDNWLCHIKDVYYEYYNMITDISNEEQRINTLCELNVINQVRNVARTSIVQKAWANKQKLFVHGWIYSLKNGLVKDLDVTMSKTEDLHLVYQLK